jgi:hypothetical protein
LHKFRFLSQLIGILKDRLLNPEGASFSRTLFLRGEEENPRGRVALAEADRIFLIFWFFLIKQKEHKQCK